jgi:F-type H+-transporting ATPase subunit b
MLSLDLATIIFQVINFLVLAVVLNRFLFQPLMRSAAQRRVEREQLQQQLAEERERVSALLAEQERWQERVEQEMQETTQRAQLWTEEERDQLLAQARADAERILVEAHADAQRLMQQALDEFHDQLVGTLLAVSASVIGRVAPTEVHDSLVVGLSDRIQEMGRSEMRRVESIRQSLGRREPTAFISSAQELTVEQQGQMAQMLTALADRRVNFELETDPELVAGVRVRLGDTVMDNSIAGRLEELRDQVLAALKEQFGNA